MPENSNRNSSITNKNNDGLRNRRTTSTAISGDPNGNSGNCNDVTVSRDATAAEYELSGDSRRTNKNGHNNKSSRFRRRTAILFLVWLVHVAAITSYVAGIILRNSSLHTGEECDMTWSVRMFLEVEIDILGTTDDNSETKTSIATKKYGLYKFVERRDPRYRQVLQRRNQQQQQHPPLGRNEHCRNSNNNIVVYVPGHWGSYDQARSLGAHGIGLTRVRESANIVREAQQRMLSSSLSSEDNSSNNTNNNSSGTGADHPEIFVYDVYALDFSEQGGGLHGQFLRYQSDFLAVVLKQLSEDCGLLLEEDEDGSSTSGGRRRNSLIVVAHSMGGYVARKVLLEHPELRVRNLITLATPHSNPLYSFDRSVSDFHRELLLEGGVTTSSSSRSSDDSGDFARSTGTAKNDAAKNKSPLVVSISGGLRDEMIEPSACRVVGATGVGVGMGDFWSGLSSPFWKTRDEGINTGALDSWTVLATKLVAHANYKSAAAATTTKTTGETLSHLPLLGMDHRAIVWCHQLLEEVRMVLWVLMASSEGTTQEQLLYRVRNAVGAGNVTVNENEHEHENFEYSNSLKEIKNGLAVRFGSWQAVCMESSMIYNLPYLLALYALLVGFRCARTTPIYRTASILPVWATILLGWIFRNDISWLSTMILVLVANSFNIALVYLMPVGFLVRRRRRRKQGDDETKEKTNAAATLEKEPKRPLRTLWDALVHLLTVILVFILAVVIAYRYLPGLDNQSFIVNNWLGLLDSALYVYTIVTIYLMLVVWIGFIEYDRNRTTIDNRSSNNNNNCNTGGESFEIQLITFVMMVIPFLAAGPLVLMAWEQQTQRSSWWTLLSLQVPVGFLASIKLSRTQRKETTHGDSNDDTAVAATRQQRGILPLTLPWKQQQSRTRSISIYFSVFILCCQKPGLLSPGAGYLVPDLAIVLVWVEIVSSLLVGYP
jgi:pimeloyl-ACP methyl ester carboxylesterase/Ca2+/Na+ antiporter